MYTRWHLNDATARGYTCMMVPKVTLPLLPAAWSTAATRWT
jgi:hypothetical protein